MALFCDISFFQSFQFYFTRGRKALFVCTLLFLKLKKEGEKKKLLQFLLFERGKSFCTLLFSNLKGKFEKEKGFDEKKKNFFDIKFFTQYCNFSFIFFSSCDFIFLLYIFLGFYFSLLFLSFENHF